ncbi:hypothetical protein F4560_003439 [Saccharothrix ecbatanensis]|uniref:Ricin B lectin domain-containing protein n=1 Tax=Saccharothrix ecbatanensis TaxID=1105145 RepID=A0A7W9HKB7_9PSEU|nr:RICIN domain-containing protein [Saccharothrix ecbatanensis]MBB5803671.1 hypothetical protein [Saccharothrix ecbatanensis]
MAGALLVLAVSLPGVPPAAGAADTGHEPKLTDSPGYHLRNVSSNLCLAARAGSGERPVVQTTCDYNADAYWPDQYWLLLPVDEANEYWRIYNTSLRLCVVARNYVESSTVGTVCGTQGTWQYVDGIWHREFSDKFDAHRYVNHKTGLCLTARGDAEIRAFATACDSGAADQHWW